MLDGSGTMDVEGERVEIGPRDARARPRRDQAQGLAGPEGMRMLVLGGCPGKAYEVPEMTELETVSSVTTHRRPTDARTPASVARAVDDPRLAWNAWSALSASGAAASRRTVACTSCRSTVSTGECM